jgi:hypothetical protein
MVEKQVWRVLFDITSMEGAIPDLLMVALISTMGISDPNTNHGGWFKSGEILLFWLMAH